MVHKVARTPDPKVLLKAFGAASTPLNCQKNSTIFSQGEPADSVFHILKGRVKISVVSNQGREAVVSVLDDGDYLGEECLVGQPLRITSAIAITDCQVLRIPKRLMSSLLRQGQGFSESFAAYLLHRNLRYQEDLANQLLNSSEKRLAQVLLLLARVGKRSGASRVFPRISHETLAQMVGTTRSRVSYFMNKFRRLGFVEYNGGLKVHSSLATLLSRE